MSTFLWSVAMLCVMSAGFKLAWLAIGEEEPRELWTEKLNIALKVMMACWAMLLLIQGKA